MNSHRSDSPATTMDLDGSNSVTSAPSPDRYNSNNSVNLDDPDVRLAAEALGDLRAGMSNTRAALLGLMMGVPVLCKKASQYHVLMHW